jgi:phosphoenolpyruvate synthase/pyruvate phosphate dikinase
MEEATLKNVDYSTDNIITDESKRERLLSTISKVALEIETLLGSAQDIEGAIAEDGTLWVVQTRPQV